MQTITGFRDVYGADVRRRTYLALVAIRAAESFGFEPIAVPILERAEMYDPRVVGLSPWPEWNPRGCFFFPIEDFKTTYGSEPELVPAVLIPEGTLSVTRWLGSQLTENPPKGLPRRVYYMQSCFRNELLDSLHAGKQRSFEQFGIEILGAESVLADIEPIIISGEILRALGVSDSAILFRISCNRLFLNLAEQSGLSPERRVLVKECLDTIAECKAGKKAGRFEETHSALRAALSEVPLELQKVWEYIVLRPLGPITSEDITVVGPFGHESLNRLHAIERALPGAGVQCRIDFCVVRSHEYYTGATFEIDLIGKNAVHVEVGGGGRYDRLMGNFTPPDGPKIIPSVGFAFGVERLQDALISEGYLKAGGAELTMHFDLEESANIARHTVEIEGCNEMEQARRYVDSVLSLRTLRVSQRIAVAL